MTVIKIRDNKVSVGIVCPFCGNGHYLTVSRKGYNLWQNGALVQKAFPELSATERESIISGMCPDCQKAFFEEDDEEDADACEQESLEFTGQWW